MENKEVILEWKQEQSTQLEDLAKQYCDIDEQIKKLTETKSSLKIKIGDLMTKYKQKKVLTEGYSVGYVHVNGSRSFDTTKAKAKLVELKVDISSFYKFGSSYDRLDISKIIEKPDNDTPDPHRVKVTLEDLNI